jgi:urease accessory protein
MPLAVAGALLAASPALAHTGDPLVAGFFAGFGHPFSGVDHLLAMVAVGWAAQIGGRSLVLLPLAFSIAMTLGAVAGASGIVLSGIELGIAASVLGLGLMVALAVRMPHLAGFTPFEAICKAWAEEPQRFRLSPDHLTS